MDRQDLCLFSTSALCNAVNPSIDANQQDTLPTSMLLDDCMLILLIENFDDSPIAKEHFIYENWLKVQKTSRSTKYLFIRISNEMTGYRNRQLSSRLVDFACRALRNVVAVKGRSILRQAVLKEDIFCNGNRFPLHLFSSAQSTISKRRIAFDNLSVDLMRSESSVSRLFDVQIDTLSTYISSVVEAVVMTLLAHRRSYSIHR
ncbi:hypothetical protein T12_16244 [Trichinella patagoniensis]|uniref:Uncharacterized protein n=1 Tax=Trichinella patagoniensis TaxID=990121 RepID=A0A0V0ZG61_9BILA|nr:hypothetical protein T12_5544 [Trichinella patagoniensis]KRY18281.1 hypothetical protein T12_16244 [Trichinella patagoniensis]